MRTAREPRDVNLSQTDSCRTASDNARHGTRRRVADPVFRVHVGDARRLSQRLQRLGKKINPEAPDTPFLTTTITSPPYAALVDYGVPGQIGHGQTFGE